MVMISPSILSADFLKLGDEIKAIEDAGADLIHVDVMDGHFVPNLTLGPPIIRAIKKITRRPLDVHLMITNAECYIDEYIDSGADYVSLHVENVVHLQRALQAIRARGKKAGVALNPSTHEQAISYVISDVDLILVMSVNPGFSGQSFIENSLTKISAIDHMLKKAGNTNCIISVDGGINNTTAHRCVNAGATCLVAGSHIFNAENYQQAISELT